MFKFYRCTPNGSCGFTLVVGRVALVVGFGDCLGFDLVVGDRFFSVGC